MSERLVDAPAARAHGSAVQIGAAGLTWSEYERVVYGGASVRADTSAMASPRAGLLRRLDAGDVVYSVNTGVGSDAAVPLPAGALVSAQRNMLRSHAVT